MALDDLDKTLIENYLDGTLTTESESDFQHKMDTSPEFKSEVELATSVLSTWKTIHNDSITKEIKEIYQEAKAEGLNKSIFPFTISAPMLYAAAVLFLIIFSTIFYNYWNAQPLNEELYVAYYRPYPADPNVRGSDRGNDIPGMREYREEKYQQAIPLLTAATDGSADQQRLVLLLGICYLETGDLANAESSFTESTSIDDAILRQNAEWYLALTYLKANDTDKSKAQLEKISASNHIYANEARLILNGIDGM